MARPIFIVDGDNSMFRAAKAYVNMKTREKKPKSTSCIFGFPNLIHKSLRMWKPKKLYVCWDGNRSKQRIELLPDYKAKRSKKINPLRDEVIRQKPKVIKLLSNLGVTQYRHEDVEGDDMIGLLLSSFKKNQRVIILSSDKDFHQYLSKKVSIFNFITRKLITPKNVYESYGYLPEETVDYLSLVGDSSDNIPGYRGMGPVKTRKFLDEFGSIKSFLKSDEEFKGIEKKKLKKWYKVARQLIDIDHFIKKHLDKDHLKIVESKPKLRLKKVQKTCDKYQINKFLKPEFIKAFEQWA